MSANTGIAPWLRMGETVCPQVYGETITSSPASTPTA